MGPGAVVVGEVRAQRAGRWRPGAESQLQSQMRVSMNVGLTASQLRQLTQVLADRVDALTMPGVRARRWSGNWPPNPESDVSAPVELGPPVRGLEG